MQDWGWMVYLHLTYGICSSQFMETRIRVIKHGETCVRTNVRFVQHTFNSITKEILWNDQWSKRMQNDAGEEIVRAKSKPMMNLVSRCSERNPDVLASTASGSLVKTRSKCQILLSSWTEQHLRTVRLVMDVCSSSYAEWNADENDFSRVEIWWSGGSKDGETCKMNNHLVCSHSTRTDLLLMTMIWAPTPSQNQICRSNPDHSCTGWILKRCNTRQ